MELTRAQHAVLNGDGFNPLALVGGYIESLGGIYLPPTAEQVQSKCTISWINVFDSVARRSVTGMAGLYVYKDSADDEDEFSVKAGLVDHGGKQVVYAGETAVGPLTRGAINYIWLDLTKSPIAAAYGAAWPTTPYVPLATINMPASTGHWLDTAITRLPVVTTRIGGGTSSLGAKLLYSSSSPMVVVTVPAGARVFTRRCWVKTAFNGATPTLTIGDAGNAARLMAATEINLKAAQMYVNMDGYQYDSETQVIATLAASGSTSGEAVILLEIG